MFGTYFSTEFDECSSNEFNGCEHECINTLGGFKCQCQIGYELHSDERRCESECLKRLLIQGTTKKDFH